MFTKNSVRPTYIWAHTSLWLFVPYAKNSYIMTWAIRDQTAVPKSSGDCGKWYRTVLHAICTGFLFEVCVRKHKQNDSIFLENYHNHNFVSTFKIPQKAEYAVQHNTAGSQAGSLVGCTACLDHISNRPLVDNNHVEPEEQSILNQIKIWSRQKTQHELLSFPCSARTHSIKSSTLWKATVSNKTVNGC